MTDCHFVLCWSVVNAVDSVKLYVKNKVVILWYFQVFVMWLSLKILCLRVLASFAGHRRLSRSLASFQWIKEITTMAFFNSKGI